MSSYDLSRSSYSDPRFHNSYGSPLVDRSPHPIAAYESSPHSYQPTPHTGSEPSHCSNGYNNTSSSSFDNCRTSVYRTSENQPYKPPQPHQQQQQPSYWSNGNTSDYHHPHHHLPQVLQQQQQSAYEGNNICPIPSSRSPSHTSSPVLNHRTQSSPAHPSSWSLSPRTTPSPQIAASPAASSSRSLHSPASPYLSQQPALIATANGSATSQGHPLQSLQHMVDPDSSNSSQSFAVPSPQQQITAITATTTSSSVIGVQMQQAPLIPTTACYSNVNDSTSSPYPTYYNMDQNRLCSAQEVSVQRGGTGNTLLEKQVRNDLRSEISADGRVLPPQPNDVNQKTPYYPHSTENGATPETHTPVNGTTDSTATTTTTAPSSSWNGTQWSGTSLSNGRSAPWPVNGTTSAGMYPGSSSMQQHQPLPPHSQPQAAFAGIAEAGQGLGAAVPQQWPAGDSAHALSLPGGAPGQVQKKKRGRPFGSKNKPKNPALTPAAGAGSSAAPPDSSGRKKPGRKPKAKSDPGAPVTATIASGDIRLQPAVTITSSAVSSQDVSGVTPGATRSSSSKKNAGPFIRVDSDRDKGLPVYTIANCAVTAAAAKDSALTVSRSRHRPNEVMALKHKAAPSATLMTPSSGFAVEKDGTWICVFCKQGPHFECLGDLFGPYFVPKSAHHSPSHSVGSDMLMHEAGAGKSGRKRKLSSEGGADASNNNQSPAGSQSDFQEVWFHEDCISWSSGVYLVGHSIRNMEEIVRDSADSVCLYFHF